MGRAKSQKFKITKMLVDVPKTAGHTNLSKIRTIGNARYFTTVSKLKVDSIYLLLL
jgi:hypothetical protein